MSLKNLYEYDPQQVKFILEDIRIVAFLYSFKMDEILNTFLRGLDNSDKILSLINFLTTHKCEKLYYNDENGIDKKINYCVAFEMLLKKITFYVDTVALTVSNFRSIIMPTFFSLLFKISSYFKIRREMLGYRVIVLNEKTELKPDVGFLSVSLNSMAALWIFGENVLSTYPENIRDTFKVYFYKIKINPGTFCIPITSLGTFNKDEQEILFTNFYTLRIDAIVQQKILFEKKKLNLYVKDVQDFEKFLSRKNLYTVEATLVARKKN